VFYLGGETMSQTQQLASLEQQAPLVYMHANIVEVLPVELQEIQQWITWEEGGFDDKGHLKKFPKGRDGTGDKWQKPHQHFAFKEAIDAKKKRGHSGVGIALPARLKDGSWLVGLDYDSVELDISVSPNLRVDEIFATHKALGRPYMEVSPSGKGVRVLVSSKNLVAQISAPNPHGGKDEMFCASGRWLTITGDALYESGVLEGTE
jgi:primase-polymerase (primpol)-like protein